MLAHRHHLRAERPTTGRGGFSLVELLVVIAILGSIVGLLLPAIQRSRESSRRADCSSRIRNMGLAVTSYELTNNAYPPGWDARPLGRALRYGTGFAWSAYILPYLEQSGIFAEIDFNKAWNDAAGNAGVADRDIAIYTCPSGILPFPGKMDYGGIMGHSILLAGHTEVIDQAWNSGILVAVNNGSIPAVRPVSVSDGLSQTLLVGESVDRKSDISPEQNIRWAWGANSFVQCEPVVNTRKAESMSSNHAGGAFGVFADGSVTFLSSRLDSDVLAALCTRNGSETLASAVHNP